MLFFAAILVNPVFTQDVEGKKKKEKKKKAKEETEEIVRPRENWVFRTDLDEAGNFVVAALHKHLWVAYDTSRCAIYKGWSGLGVVKRREDGPPVAEGYPFMDYGARENVWKVVRNGQTYSPKTQWKSIFLGEQNVTLGYWLILEDGTRITVEEIPEFIRTKKDDGNRIGFERIFRVVSAPEDVDVLLEVDCESMLHKGDLKSNGKFQNVNKKKRHFSWGSLYDFTGDLKLDKVEEVSLKMIFTVNPEAESQ